MSASDHMMDAVADFKDAARKRLLQAQVPTALRLELEDTARHMAGTLLKHVPALRIEPGRAVVEREFLSAVDELAA